MMIIDAHCHLSKGRGQLEIIINDMDAAGVDKAVVFGSGAALRPSIDNEYVLGAVEEYPDRFIPFVYFDPRYEEQALEEVDRYVGDLGWKGIKVGHQHANARYMYPMMEKAEEYGAVVVVHSDHSVRNHPYIIGDVANSYPEVPTVILHMGGGTCFDSELLSTKIAAKNPNVYLETCYSNPDAIKQAVDVLGAERVMYGSDSSNGGYGSRYEEPGQYMDLMLDAVRLAGLSAGEEKMVLGGSAARLLGVS